MTELGQCNHCQAVTPRRDDKGKFLRCRSCKKIMSDSQRVDLPDWARKQMGPGYFPMRSVDKILIRLDPTTPAEGQPGGQDEAPVGGDPPV
jgi:hypothetical protein